MNITEIIERLKNIAEHAVHTVGERPFIMSLDDGIAVHKAIELLKKAETNCPEIPDSWIPVSERLPVEKQDVLIMFNNNMAVGFWEETLEDGNPVWYANSGDGWYTGTENVDSDGVPIAWMPLPEPHKEGE